MLADQELEKERKDRPHFSKDTSQTVGGEIQMGAVSF